MVTACVACLKRSRVPSPQGAPSHRVDVALLSKGLLLLPPPPAPPHASPQVWEEGQTLAETQSCGAQGGTQPPAPGLRPRAVCPLGTVKLPPPLARLVSLDILHRGERKSSSPELKPLLLEKGLSWTCLAIYANVCKCSGPWAVTLAA